MLAIETSGSSCSAGLMISDFEFAGMKIQMKHIHSEKLFLLIDNVLKSCGKTVDEIKEIAVSAGPGSFTGLRIGMSAAKGISLRKNIPIVPVPTFEAMALKIASFTREGDTFIICNSVNRDEIYYMKFINKLDSYQIIENLRLLPKNEFPLKVSGSDLIFGDYTGKNSSINFTAPDAEYVAKWSYIFGDKFLTYSNDYLEPNYLKKFIVKEKK